MTLDQWLGELETRLDAVTRAVGALAQMPPVPSDGDVGRVLAVRQRLGLPPGAATDDDLGSVVERLTGPPRFAAMDAAVSLRRTLAQLDGALGQMAQAGQGEAVIWAKDFEGATQVVDHDRLGPLVHASLSVLPSGHWLRGHFAAKDVVNGAVVLGQPVLGQPRLAPFAGADSRPYTPRVPRQWYSLAPCRQLTRQLRAELDAAEEQHRQEWRRQQEAGRQAQEAKDLAELEEFRVKLQRLRARGLDI